MQAEKVFITVSSPLVFSYKRVMYIAKYKQKNYFIFWFVSVGKTDLKECVCAIKSLKQLYRFTILMSCCNSSEFMGNYSVEN